MKRVEMIDCSSSQSLELVGFWSGREHNNFDHVNDYEGNYQFLLDANFLANSLRIIEVVRGLTMKIWTVLSAGIVASLSLAQPLPIRGVDISTLPEVEYYGGGTFFKSDGSSTDLIGLIKARGGNLVRLRVWNAPSKDGNGNPDPAGKSFCDLQNTISMAKRAKAAGLKVLIDFHYSDWWADPGNQNKPAAWSSLSLSDLKVAIKDFTKSSLAQMISQGVTPDYVQPGNEITNGFLWPTGQLYGGDNSWAQFTDLLKSAISGIREASPTSLVMIHCDKGGDAGGALYFYDNLLSRGVSFEVVGLSYYSWWQGSLDALSNTLYNVELRYKKPVLVTETSYPFSLQSGPNQTSNFINSSTLLIPGAPATPDGQNAYLKMLNKVVAGVANHHGLGVVWWEPAWVSTPSNKGGWDNLNLVDFSSKELPGLTTLLAGNAPVPAGAPIKDDVFYQFMPIAWRNANGANGQYNVRFGDFQGMTQSLEYLQGLGVTAVWMTPIFPSDAYHGYQHGDASQLNPWFGSKADWLNFVRSAHSRGIKVFIDFVEYGISQKSIYFQNAYNNPSSVYTSWLNFTNAQNTTFGGYNYPTWNGTNIGFIYWNLNSPDSRNLVTTWSKLWLDPLQDGSLDAGVDGFRLDSVWKDGNYGPGYTVANFWNQWNADIKKVNPNAFVFAEQGDWSLTGAELTPPMDGTFTIPFMFAARNALNAQNASGLYQSMATAWANRPLNGRNFIGILGNHDNDRLATVIGDLPGRNKLAASLLLAQPFPPCIYFGDELGMRGNRTVNYNSDANDIPVREPFKWNAVDSAPMSEYYKLNSGVYANRFSKDNDGRSVQEQTGVSGSLLETYRNLVSIRKQQPALRSGTYEPISGSSGAVYAYVRRLGSDSIVVLQNLSSSAQSFSLNLNAYNPLASAVQDLITGNMETPIGFMNKRAYPVSLPGYGYKLLKVKMTRYTQPTPIDGQLPDQDSALCNLSAFQTQPTTFTNAAGALDTLLTRFDQDGVYLGIGGNVPTDASTSLVVMIDTGAPGQSTLNLSGLSSPPPGIAALNGTKLDSGFAPSRMVFVNAYGGSFYVDAFAGGASGSFTKNYLGTGSINSGCDGLLTGTNTYELLASLNNTNTTGVTTTSGANALNVKSGLELKIPYAQLGVAPSISRLKVAVCLVKSASVSNQWLPALPGQTADLGMAPNVAGLPGVHYVTITR